MAVTNPYYEFTPPFVPGTKVRSDEVNTQYQAIQSAFDLLPGDGDALTTGTSTFAPETGSGNAYVVTMPDTRTSNQDGDEVVFFATHSSTSATPTLNVDGIGAVTIVATDGSPLASGDILDGVCVALRYDATNVRFQLMTPAASDLGGGGGGGSQTPWLQNIDAAGFDLSNLGDLTLGTDNEFRMDNSFGPTYDFRIENVTDGGYWRIHAIEGLYINGGEIINYDRLTGSSSTPPVAADNHFASFGLGDHNDNSLGFFGYAASGEMLIRAQAHGAPISFNAEDDAGVNRNLLRLDPDTQSVVLPIAGTAANPALAFGDGDSGFFEVVDDTVDWSSGGVARVRLNATGVGGTTTGSGIIANVVASATAASIRPSNTDPDTGFGWAAADQLSLIAGGVEMLRLTETGLATTDQVIIAPAGIIGAAATPALAFGDGDTGFYESIDDTLRVSVNGTGAWEFTSNYAGSSSGTRGVFRATNATATTPSIVPVRDDLNSGIGQNADDQLSLIAGGVEMLRLVETGVSTTDQVIIGPAGIIGTSTAPALAFGDGDTGFYESIDDDLGVTIFGTRRFLWSNNQFKGENGASAMMLAVAASSTVPTLIPDQTETDTGIGHAGADEPNLIGGGVELARGVAVASGGLQANNQSTASGLERVLTETDKGIVYVKTADEVVNNSITLQDDNHLTAMTLETDTRYRIQGNLFGTDGPTGGWRFALVFTNTMQEGAMTITMLDAAGGIDSDSVISDYSGSTIVFTGVATAVESFIFDGVVRTNATTGGTFKLQWAQQSAAVGDNTLLASSYLKVTKLVN